MYQRKTVDEYSIQGNYGFGFEEVTCCHTWKEKNQLLKEYRENEPGIPFRSVCKRTPRYEKLRETADHILWSLVYWVDGQRLYLVRPKQAGPPTMNSGGYCTIEQATVNHRELRN